MFEFFGIIDIVSFTIWMLIFGVGAFLVHANNKNNPEFKYYLLHFYFKILAGFGFALVYMFYYERHGDTVFYWDGARKLSQLLFENPSAYFKEIFFEHDQNTIPTYFKHVGYPPVWTYNEPNSWFVCKIASIFSLFTFGSYITLNLFFSVISTWVSWRFFRFINSILKTETKYTAIACLFIPSVAFWCTGLSKDTIALCAILVLIMSYFKFLNHSKITFKLSVYFIFSCFILLSIRPFLIVACFIPFIILFTFRLNKTKPFMIRFATRLIGVVLAFLIIVVYFQFNELFGEFSATKFIETAEVISMDMMNNAGYTGKRYDLGITDFSAINMIAAIPAAIGATLFRPFIWEADSVLMLFNGIENIFILYFCFRMFFFLTKKGSFSELRKNDFYLFAFIFVLVLGYFVGLTSVLFGVLVRMKAPILPFFVLLISYPLMKKDSKETTIDSAK
ncbi:MAG TPA: hypothetical protein PLI97_08795 [Fluviicola sp.]|nr:hypothetical protein [Fluviicola sp.]